MHHSHLEAVLLAQGDELTTGQTVDTNSNWLAGRLWALGIPVRRVITAPDRMEDLVEILAQAAALAPIVLCTGGLGPTRDDLTAEAASLAFARPLGVNPEARAQVEVTFSKWGRVLNEANQKQAVLPEGARVLENRWGTAPGFAIDLPASTLYFMPGVPREMKPMFETWVEPDLRARHDIAPPVLHIIRTIGLPESELEMRLRGLDVPGLTIGFRTALPENQAKLLFRSEVSAGDRAAALEEALRRLGSRAFGVDCGDLAEVVGEALVSRGETLALAESCTAGRLAAWVGSIAGASRYLLEGSVVYSNAAKTRSAGVDPALIAEHGAVSEPVARALAEGIRARAGATWGIGITGIAGPDGGTPEKPVGTLHVAVAGPGGTEHRALALYGDRDRITASAAANALFLLFSLIRVPR